MRLARIPIELVALIYMLAYIPYIIITRLLSTTPNREMGRPLTGLEVLPPTLILGCVMIGVFIWLSGWWRSAHLARVGPLVFPVPTIWTALSGVGTALLLFTVPLSLTFEGVSIPFMQLLMRGDVLIIAPLVDLIARRKVRWYSWVALVLVLIGLGATIQARGGLNLPPLAIVTIVLYTLGYFIRLSVMTRTSKTGDEGSVQRYFVEEKMVGMPLAVLALWVITLFPSLAQGSQLDWGFVDVWRSSALTMIIALAVFFFAVSIFSALILLDKRENTFCVPFERAASILAGVIGAFLLAMFFGAPYPTQAELVGAALLTAAIVLLSVGPRLGKPASVQTGTAP